MSRRRAPRALEGRAGTHGGALTAATLGHAGRQSAEHGNCSRVDVHVLYVYLVVEVQLRSVQKERIYEEKFNVINV